MMVGSGRRRWQWQWRRRRWVRDCEAAERNPEMRNVRVGHQGCIRCIRSGMDQPGVIHHLCKDYFNSLISVRSSNCKSVVRNERVRDNHTDTGPTKLARVLQRIQIKDRHEARRDRITRSPPLTTALTDWLASSQKSHYATT